MRRNSRGNEICDFMGKSFCFSRSCACDNQNRTICRKDRLFLSFIETL